MNALSDPQRDRLARSDAAASDALYTLEGAAFDAEDGRTLLAPLTLTLQPKRMSALIGHNGSGKSTLVKLLARQQAPSRGSVRLFGKELAAWPAREFARRIAYLPQQPPAATDMTVRELVALGRYPWHGALGRLGAADREKIDEALELTDTARFASQLADRLSGGERQRVWLAMLVAQGADCLLLDEPTSALDIAHQIDVLRLLRTLTDTRGLTVVIVLHDINLAARFSDELIALHSGRLLARGTPQALMRPDTLESIYGIPMDVVAHPRGGWLGVAH
ncbi:iron complex transport system ATP-binding protein [Paraburkholderia eburnea]|uniref:Iron complex transport system ATP-binding protein n=1 Tax=Paraburkholderia eburnea TaxID=1189126 RepID=A0A2S4LV08_9BURK|nr:iron complex transport system ATP-binding protein [Paraburkholderia eburnea]PRZ16244.1 iron complex transport system ATP-binding protein [Paraburkholderia eburnea]